jgi:hypothetical protein
MVPMQVSQESSQAKPYDLFGKRLKKQQGGTIAGHPWLPSAWLYTLPPSLSTILHNFTPLLGVYQ